MEQLLTPEALVQLGAIGVILIVFMKLTFSLIEKVIANHKDEMLLLINTFSDSLEKMTEKLFAIDYKLDCHIKDSNKE